MTYKIQKNLITKISGFLVAISLLIGFLMCISPNSSVQAAEAVATVLALKHGIVPPTINLDEPDPECDLDYTPNTPVEAPLTMAISDSLGFGGHNGCVAFRKL
jgi:hypothetical protein